MIRPSIRTQVLCSLIFTSILIPLDSDAGFFGINLNPMTYFRGKANIEDFTSTLPLFHIETEYKKKSRFLKTLKRESVTRQEKKAEFSKLDAPESTYSTVDLFAESLDKLPAQVKLRGHSSLIFDQKQYGIKFDEKESLFGLPKAKEWVFHAPYIDKSLMKNALTYSLARKLKDSHNENWYAPHTAFVEGFVNGEYKGIYTAIEKLSVGKHRIELSEFDPHSANAQDFLIEVGSASKDDIVIKSAGGVPMILHYPSKKDFREQEKDHKKKHASFLSHMHSVIDRFEISLRPENIEIEQNGPEQFADIPSFVNYFLIQELTKNVDGYRRSVFFHFKDGKIHAGPVWDFNIAWGGLLNSHEEKAEGWQILLRHQDGVRQGNVSWFSSLFKSPRFRKKLVEAYSKLREMDAPFEEDEIYKEIDQNVRTIGDEAVFRHFTKWNLLGGPIVLFCLTTCNNPNSYAGEIDKLKDWIHHRLVWLDRAFQNLGAGLPADELTQEEETQRNSNARSDVKSDVLDVY